MLVLKTTCLLRGIAGGIFGFFALFFPVDVKLGFDVLFWTLIDHAIVLFLLLAITARINGSIVWFGLSAALFGIGVISIMVPKFVAVVLIQIIAAAAIVNGFTDIALALWHPITKYLRINGIIIAALILLAIVFFYFPVFRMNRILSVVVTSALVFGLFSIIPGCYKTEETVTTA